MKRAGVIEPPVPVADIAAMLGVPVMKVALPSWFTGALVMQDGSPVLMLNSSANPETRRAALGHLLGHLLARIDDPSEPFPRGSEAVHRAADAMSDEFVMPGYLVREQAAKWFNDHRYLARLFGVSEVDMLDKMRDLGIIRARGIGWDY